MNILLVGSGGREHALAWALSKSPLCERLFCAPGNAGIEEISECVAIDAEDIEAIAAFATEKKNKIGLVVVGPEGPLVKGLADLLKRFEVPVFGPSTEAARLEGSKAFMKDLCKKYKIPTARYERFTDLGEALLFMQDMNVPIVIKTDGLAAGKGVIIAQDYEEAVKAAEDMLSGESFGSAGAEIVIEEFLDGEELSYFALSDGKNLVPFGSAQDHKRVYDNDEGPNTGGMGAYSPAHLMTPELEQTILKTIIQPTINGMAAEGAPFTGVLFAGIMVVKGKPILLEHNVRFGDPECQTLMKRFEGDLVHVLHAAALGKLDTVKDQMIWSDDSALCVVMAANGYPGSYEKGTQIRGLSKAAKVSGVDVFHAGTKRNDEGIFVSNGGRVLGVTALGNTIAQAQKTAYEAVDLINWPDGFCRRDIGWQAVQNEKSAVA